MSEPSMANPAAEHGLPVEGTRLRAANPNRFQINLQTILALWWRDMIHLGHGGPIA